MDVGFIGAKRQIMLGHTYTDEEQELWITRCNVVGSVDVVVVSAQSGKNGINLQGMNSMISIGWMSVAEHEHQAIGKTHVSKGNLSDRSLLSTGAK